jgi:hypothetical protein
VEQGDAKDLLSRSAGWRAQSTFSKLFSATPNGEGSAEENRIHVYRRGDFSRCMRHAKDVVSTVGLCTTLQEWILRISDHSIVDTACTCWIELSADSWSVNCGPSMVGEISTGRSAGVSQVCVIA